MPYEVPSLPTEAQCASLTITVSSSTRLDSLGIRMLKSVARRLRIVTGLSPSKKKMTTTTTREGHFVVIVVQGKEPKRFFIRLDHLYDPCFLKLLKQAEEEFGFAQEGPIELPCRPDELLRISSNIKAMA
ncbi:hypothetical protein GQ457_11G007880 [Hibiscus cannabinus]